MSEIVFEHIFSGGQRVQLVQGDITEEQVDAIVNPANAQLQHGGGLAAIIARKGGPTIQQESDEWVRKHGAVRHEAPVATMAGELACRYVIHAVGPVWGSGDEDDKLAAAVAGSLALAEQLRLTSVSLPAISTGIFGFPKERAAGVIFGAVNSYFEQDPDASLTQVRVTVFDQPTTEAFVKVWEQTDWR